MPHKRLLAPAHLVDLDAPQLRHGRPDGEGTQKSWNSAVNYLLEIDGNYVPIKADGVALKTEDSEATEEPR